MRDEPISGCAAPNPEELPACNPFGTRYLTDESRIFEHNAWDNVEWPEEMQARAEEIVLKQKEGRVDEETAAKLIANPVDQWDAFYAQMQNKFFKDRQWILREFHELDPRHVKNEGKEKITVLEVGCGVGNTTFPMLDGTPQDGSFFLYASDYSQEAVNVLKSNEKYDPQRICAFRWDITQSIEMAGTSEEELPSSSHALPTPASIDYIVCVYVLSAIHPSKLKTTLENLIELLKPGGMLVLKDYGRYDLTQLRFKKNRLIEENLYCRGDGTLVHFFDLEELDKAMEDAGLKKLRSHIDKRLIINRGEKKVMYRRWIQAKYEKP